MAKKVKAIVKLQIPAGSATPAPPVGPALGQQGVNIMEFCKQFNAKTASQEQGIIIPVIITVFEDRSFDFIMKTAPAAELLKKAAGAAKGAANPLKEKVGVVSKAQLEEIAKVKMVDLNANDVEGAMKIVAGSARSMGIKIE